MGKNPMRLPVLVIGAGAWGTAIAVHFARRTDQGWVILAGRDADQMLAVNAHRENKKYLPGVILPATLQVTSDLSAACVDWRAQAQATGAGLLILATPLSGLEASAAEVFRLLGPPRPGEGLLWLAKGLRLAGGFQWPHQIVSAQCKGWPSGALSGPSFAQEVAAGLPVALTLASQDLVWARTVAQACHGAGLRVYATNDLVGVELGGAMKNVLAIAAGVCDGLALGANARAALLTRGLAEMSRLGVAIGAQASTFMGLATLGDLILTATGDLSRNRRVGLALAAGERIETILRDLGHVAEGVPTAPALLKLAQAHSVDVPITQSVAQLLSGQCRAKQAIDNLMSREPRDEYAG